MALTNAEKQKRWREKRNRLAASLIGKPKEIADSILLELGPDQTRKIARALEKRLRNLRRDCQVCRGTGFYKAQLFTACGILIEGANPMFPCGCEPGCERVLAERRERENGYVTCAVDAE